MAITGHQLRAARALAGIDQTQLAKASKVSINTIRKMEARADQRVRVRLDTMERISDALEEDFGVKFTDTDDVGGPGVRLIRRPRKRATVDGAKLKN